MLAFVEAVNFVDEQNGLAAQRQVLLRLLHGSAYVFDAGKHRRQRDELETEGAGGQPGQRGFADTGRAPENHRMRLARLKGQAQRFARADQVRLAYDFVQGFGPQRFGQRSAGGLVK